ncbi:uncharacterized protein LOC142625070 [Castanea sativa]|uniref:uncharacterized protein LOC142625070 n=1 Tax=Castanea sativa TaxID=21020 RepID=UPI003F651500
MLQLYKFLEPLTKLILSCISTSSISVLLNGGKLESFLPSRGIRQGDPLSPYLFIMCIEMLGFLIDLKSEEKLWDPVKASRNGPAFSHLFFADDLVLFAKANLKNCDNVKETLDTFCELSRQKRVQTKLQGWKASLLSMAGSVILTQSVTSAIPSWLNEGTIQSLVEGPLNRGEDEVTMIDLMQNGIWATDNVSLELPADVLKAIKATPIHRSARRKDQRCWVSSANGQFESKSAYLLAVNEDPSIQDFADANNGVPNCVADLRKGNTKTSRLVKWLKPPDGWWKLNTDGSFLAPSGLAGGGGIIRDSKGQCIGGFAKACVVTSSLAAELWALREGLLRCIEMHAQVMELELDAIAAVSLISCNASTNGDFSILVDDCRDLLLQLPQVKILHCYREANCCANALARMGSTNYDVEISFVTPPPMLISLLEFDMLGTYHPRLCSALADISV